MKLSFTLKNIRRKTNSKFEFQKLPFWTPEKACFLVFDEKSPQKSFSSCFGLDSALNNRHTNVLLVGIFENALKKLSKTLFLVVINFF